MNSVRFRQVGSFVNCEGLLRCDGARLHLEYQRIDGIVGALKSGIKQVDIPLADVVSIELAGWWMTGYKIRLQARTMEAVREVPGMSQGCVEFPIARADCEAAKALIASLQKPEATDDFGRQV